MNTPVFPVQLRTLIQQKRDELLAAEDTLCFERYNLVTEAYQQYADHPIVIKRARVFAHVLSHMTLDLESNPIFAGNTASAPRAWMLLPEYNIQMVQQVAIENPEIAHILEDARLNDYADGFWKTQRFGKSNSSIGHLAVDLDTVLKRGLKGILEDIEAAEKITPTDETTSHYRQAMRISLQAVIDWAARYAAAAAELAQCITAEPVVPEIVITSLAISSC